MKKYLVLYKAPVSASKRMAEVPAEQQAEGMKAWMTWAQNCGDKLSDLGQPLANGINIISGAAAESAESEIGGFSILQAADREEALQLLKNHPHLQWNEACTIELHEAMPIPGM
ncbi:MAG: hypothetical protein J7539_02060 [Niabella sp.]|nr:hypothetical protein [Niabella sp.]